VIRSVRNIVNHPPKDETPEVAANRGAIRDFTERYGNNVIFIHLPQKKEIIVNAVSSLGQTVRREIKLLGGDYYDGQAFCGMTKDDYFVNDAQPNAVGYGKISACVGHALKQKWSVSPRWSVQNRPFMVTSKPAINGRTSETGLF
jgi:hypothetical protein